MEYKSTDSQQQIFSYTTNDIGLFEALQASSHDLILMNMIIHYYKKDRLVYDYEEILNHLKYKLNFYNHHIKKFNIFFKIPEDLLL